MAAEMLEKRFYTIYFYYVKLKIFSKASIYRKVFCICIVGNNIRYKMLLLKYFIKTRKYKQ